MELEYAAQEIRFIANTLKGSNNEVNPITHLVIAILGTIASFMEMDSTPRAILITRLYLKIIELAKDVGVKI